MTANDLDLQALRTATTDLVGALSNVEDGHWKLPTPCADWSLRDLVDHVIGGNWYSVRILAGDTSEDALAAVLARFGDEPVSAAGAVESAFDQLGAFEKPGVLNATWNHAAGKLAGRQILRLRLHDLVVHTWDVNETRRPPASIPRPLAEWGLAELGSPDSLMAKHFNLPPAPSDRPVPDNTASAYLHAFGR